MLKAWDKLNIYVRNYSRKSEGKRHFQETRLRWEDNITMDLREIVYDWGQEAVKGSYDQGNELLV
jgi:hypothetical protein